MVLFARLWNAVADLAGLLFLTTPYRDADQFPLIGHPGKAPPKSPLVFIPPGTNLKNFTCDYSAMGPEWSSCNHLDRTCWLQHKNGTKLNITTDYESRALTPKGVTRIYNLTVNDSSINPNGIFYPTAKLFNEKFPGPLIEACWGDQVLINVTNKMQFNGTSIHWHGIRQLDTMHMDGVNGVTQCPIAPNDSFVYDWTAMQYGSSWYHSHFSVQYADGLQGAITIHGPTSAQYDYPIDPIVVGDWMNNSAFEVIFPNVKPIYPDILMNGTGNINRFNNQTGLNTSKIPDGFEIHLQNTTSPTKYLLRLINTAFTTTFVFSIDNHSLTVVEADFVPVKALPVNAITIGIGQRYHFILETLNSSTIGDGNFWIRTNPVNGCDSFMGKGLDYMKTGILRYNSSSTTPPGNQSQQWPEVDLLAQSCSDLAFNKQLKPMYNWTVGLPGNGALGEQFDVTFEPSTTGPYATAFFALNRNGSKDGVIPFQTTYGDPTFLNMGTNIGDTWPLNWVVVPEDLPKKLGQSPWVYLNITSTLATHPIHLHGHDFAILLQNDTSWPPPPGAKLNTDNPPRRDVIIIGSNGGAIIAFKPDNPGVWLMHCHIATHASSGLGLQILERQADANAIWPPGNSNALKEASRVCANWNSWAYDCRNYWPGNNGTVANPDYPSCDQATELQNDAGI